jgi:predicted metal-dependent HD superfamily phosphohydrolase
VPDEAFRAGRMQVLQALLELPSIYRLAPLKDAWEEKARANLTTELGVLDAGAPQP